jgi:N-formylglutamate amidohydrolase
MIGYYSLPFSAFFLDNIKILMNLYTLKRPAKKTNNIIYNCPHSGENFPDGFFKNTDLDINTLLLSSDSFVDELFSEASENGSVIMSNNYSRSFIDTNREAFELDPSMFSGEITKNLNANSMKVKLGYGSIAKYAFTQLPIYKDKIPFQQALDRLEKYYFPVHQQLNAIQNEDIENFGYSLLVDCHSMPSYEFLGQNSNLPLQPDIVLGDFHGRSCNSKITEFLINHFRRYDLSVSTNSPFAGGYNTQHYGNPDLGKHAIQIEIKKSLYMDEKERCINQFFEPVKIIMSLLCYHLGNEIEKILGIEPK